MEVKLTIQVTYPTTQSPEEIRVLGARCANELAVGGDDLKFQDLIRSHTIQGAKYRVAATLKIAPYIPNSLSLGEWFSLSGFTIVTHRTLSGDDNLTPGLSILAKHVASNTGMNFDCRSGIVGTTVLRDPLPVRQAVSPDGQTTSTS